MYQAALKYLGKIYYGWWMLGAGAAIRVLGGGFHFYGFTVFFLPLSQDLGLSRAATALAFSLARAEGAIEGPVAGYLIDRFGPRPIMLFAVFLSGVGYMTLSTVNNYAAFLFVYLGIISLSFSSGFMHSPMVVANSWFIRRRALAMTMISASIGVGGTLISPLLAMTVQTWGWRQGALLAGFCLLLFGLPLASLVRRSPESMGLLPDGVLADEPARSETSENSQAGRSGEEAAFTAKQAMRTPVYWLITLATLVRVAGFSIVLVHFIPIMVWKGLSQERAAFFLATFAMVSLPSHLLLGWMADFVNKPRLMAVSTALAAGATFILIYGRSEWVLWLFIPFFAPVEAVFPVSWANVGDFFGRKHFGAIRGTMAFFYMWGGVLGPVAAGAVYDRSQSYGPLLPWMVVLFSTAALLYSLLVKPLPPTQKSDPLRG